MIQATKLIWRLDFNVSYVYLDKRGTALNAMQNTVKDFWDVVADGTVHSSYTGTTTREDYFRGISVEPNSLNGELEWTSGLDLSRVLKDESFRGTDKVLREVLKVFDIKSVGRSGWLTNLLPFSNS
jgi:hypothetical protein